MYVKDFDGNGFAEQIISLLQRRRELSARAARRPDPRAALRSRRATSTTRTTRGQTVDGHLPVEGARRRGASRRAYTFATSLAHNNGDGSFTLVPLPDEAQIAPVYGILATDVDRDGHTDLLLAGNFDGFKPEIGRMAASYGLCCAATARARFTPVRAHESGFMVPGQTRDIQRVRTATGELIVVARNNDRPLVFRSVPAGPLRGEEMTMQRRHQAMAMAALVAMTTACAIVTRDSRPAEPDAEVLHAAVHQLSSVMVYDIFSPPQASRVYAYATVAAYEALRAGHPDYRSFAGQLNGLAPVPAPEPGAEYSIPLAGVHAFMTVGRQLTFSRARMDSLRSAMDERFRGTLSPAVYQRSIAYGDTVAKHVLAWASKDRFLQTRGYPKYTVSSAAGRWVPTPPAYMDAVEANWGLLRPFVMDSGSLFRPVAAAGVRHDEEQRVHADGVRGATRRADTSPTSSARWPPSGTATRT